MDSAAYAILTRLDIDTSVCDFDFSEAVSIISSEQAFMTYGQIISNIVHNSLSVASEAISRFDTELIEQNREAEQELDNNALFAELSEKLFMYDNNGANHTCRVIDVHSNNVVLSDVNSKEKFTVTIPDFYEKASEYIEEENGETDEQTQDVSDNSEDDDLIAFAEMAASFEADESAPDKSDDDDLIEYAEAAAKAAANEDAAGSDAGEQLSFFGENGQMSFFAPPSSERKTKSAATTDVKPKQRRRRETASTSTQNNRVLNIRSITDDMVDYVLRCGANNDETLERIIAQFQKGKTDAENGDFIRNEFASGHTIGRGYVFKSDEYPSGIHICSDFTGDKLLICAGDTADIHIAPNITVPWSMAAHRISEMLESGEYCSQDIIDRAESVELKDLSEDIALMKREINKDLYNDFFVPEIQNDSIRGDYPEIEAFLQEQLKNKETVQQYIVGLEKLCEAYNANNDVIPAWYARRSYNPNALLNRLNDLLIERKQFKTNEAFSFVPEYFLSEAEIVQHIRRGQPYEHGRITINKYFTTEEHSREEKARYLKQFYGEYGGSWAYNIKLTHSSKGFEIEYPALYGSNDVYVKFSWSEMADRITQLIEDGKYVSQEDIDRYTEYCNDIIQRHNSGNDELISQSRYNDAVAFLKENGGYDETVSDPQIGELNDMELIKAILRTETFGNGSHILKKPKSEIIEFFKSHSDFEKYDYVESLYDHGVYTEFDGRSVRVGFIADNHSIHIWSGGKGYLTRTQENVLDWSDVADIIGDMIADGTYLTDAADAAAREEKAEVNQEIIEQAVALAESNEPIEEDETEIDTINLHKVGDFYEVYGDEAIIVSDLVGLTLTRKDGKRMVGFPDYLKQTYTEQLENAGFKVESDEPDNYPKTAKVLNVVASRNYRHLLASFPAIMERQYTYMQFSAGESFDKLNIEWISSNELAISHSYIQNGDLMRDPEIVLLVDVDEMVVFPIEYQNDSLHLYGRYEAGDKSSTETNGFVSNWLRNIDSQGYKLIHSVRYDNQKRMDISKDYDRPLDEDRYDLFYINGSNGVEVYNRLDVVSNKPEIEFRKVAKISTENEINYLSADIPDYYKEQISEYSQRIGVSLDLLSAYTLTYIFNKAYEGKKFDEQFDLLALEQFCINSVLYDRDLNDFYKKVISYPDDVTADDLQYALNMLSEIIDSYEDNEQAVKYSEANSFIIDEAAAAEIFNQIYVSNRAAEKAAAIGISSEEFISESEEREDNKLLTTIQEHFGEYYDKLYEQGDDAVEGYNIALVVGDQFIKENTAFVEQFNQLRHDILSSDREVAAFAFALVESGVIEDFNKPKVDAPDEALDNPLDFKEGDIVYTGGSDRQFVITKIDRDAKTATIRDDNTGWYPLFQEVPIWQLTALAEQNELQNTFDPDDDEIDSDNGVEYGNYVITDDNIGVATPKVRAANNIRAIEIVEQLIKENRNATDEEKLALASYVGWGSLPDVFDERKDNFLSERQRLQELLTEKEYQSARESTLTAFYTQPVVIRSVYQALSNMGFEGGKILEPSMGVGNFFGAMPQDIAKNSQLYGVEIDRITGNIAKQLYPSANIAVKGFEDFNAPDNSFDVVIGNVPFADFKVFDTRYNKHNLLIHDYFFAKAVDKVKPGGIVAFITSKGTLDKQNSKFRKMLCEKAELLGAIRLPNTAFKANAGTEVISDIIFLKKRPSITAVKDNWVETTYSDQASSFINNYFIENPDMICGELATQSTQFGYDIDVKPFENISLEEALAERISKLQGRFEPIDHVVDFSSEDKSSKYIALIDESIPPYCYGQLADGTIAYREGNMLRIDNISPNAVKYYQAAIRLSKAVRYIINVQQETPDGYNEDILNRNFELARQELNEAYDKFAALGIRVNDNNKRSFRFNDDNNYGLMCSLEAQVDQPDGTKKWIKSSDLFERRTIVKRKEITHCETLGDAFMVCLNYKSHIDLDYICRLTDRTLDDAISELDGTYMYRNPEKYDENDNTVGWEPADEYLSGNIRYKLQLAKDLAESNPAFQKNVTALEGVMPENIPASEIAVQLGSSWVPTDVIEKFMFETFQLPEYMKSYCKVEHDLPTATWYISEKSMSRRFSTVSELYGTDRMNGMEVLEHSLNMRRCTIYDRVEDADGTVHSVKNAEETAKICIKQDELKQAFIDWVYKDAERTKRLEEIYNIKYNSERVRKFDGSHLTFDGMNTTIELQPHQKNAVARILYGGNTLLAHVVGAGKTFEITAACMELKRTGAANKALIVVPNHLIGQWGKEFLTLYPGANILLARSEDFKKDNRKKFIGRIATGDYDAIIMGYSTFSKIGISAKRRKAYYEEEIHTCMENLQNVKKGSLTEKQLNKYRKQLEGSLKSLEYVVDQDKELTFEELGVDWLYVDEAHNFKNLQLNTKLGRVAGIQTANSKRAEDLLLKIRYLNEQQGAERGVVLATGTPISNSLVEMYTMQKYLQADYLKSKGVSHFDSWAADFAKIEANIELDPTGNGFRSKTRCSAFNNLPELMIMFNRCTDIQTADMLNLPVPKLKDGQYNICVCTPSPEQKAFVKRCGERAEAIHNKRVDISVDNMLCVTNDGKMCALDMRLVDPDADDDPNSKINIAIENIYNKWAETKEHRLTQIVFLDKCTPKPNEFNLYDDIRNKLVERGIPKNEIRFIHEAKNDNEKIKLFDEVNAGAVRIIIGSTEKMGAGTNIQAKLCALHHLDVPWRPSDIEQREGRILRRGNTCEEVEIYRYVTEGTFDAYSWQTIEGKQKFISQVMTGRATGRSAEDVDSAVLNYAEIKALATGDPRIKEHFDLSEEVNQLRMKKGSWEKSHIAMRDRLAFHLPKIIQQEKDFVNLFKAEKEYAINNSRPFDDDTYPFFFKLGGKTYDKREEAGEKILSIAASGAAFATDYPLGTYRGFDLSMHYSALENGHVFVLKHKCRMECLVGESSVGMFRRLDNLIDKHIDTLLAEHSQRFLDAVKEKETCEQHANEPFPQAKELKEKEKRLAELTKELAFDDHSEGEDLVDVIDVDKGRK